MKFGWPPNGRRSDPQPPWGRPAPVLVLDDYRPLLDLSRQEPREYPPVTYLDGSTSDISRALDVIADAAAAPGHGPDAA